MTCPALEPKRAKRARVAQGSGSPFGGPHQSPPILFQRGLRRPQESLEAPQEIPEWASGAPPGRLRKAKQLQQRKGKSMVFGFSLFRLPWAAEASRWPPGGPKTPQEALNRPPRVGHRGGASGTLLVGGGGGRWTFTTAMQIYLSSIPLLYVPVGTVADFIRDAACRS